MHPSALLTLTCLVRYTVGCQLLSTPVTALKTPKTGLLPGVVLGSLVAKRLPQEKLKVAVFCMLIFGSIGLIIKLALE